MGYKEDLFRKGQLEIYNQKLKKKTFMVTLPCSCDTHIEVEKPEDFWAVCPKCKQKFFTHWSKIERHKSYG